MFEISKEGKWGNKVFILGLNSKQARFEYKAGPNLIQHQHQSIKSSWPEMIDNHVFNIYFLYFLIS